MKIKLCKQRISVCQIRSPHIFNSMAAMWQLLPLPPEYKNGSNILLAEDFYLLSPAPFLVNSISLYFENSCCTSKGQKIAELSLELGYQDRVVARLGLTLMTEVDWNEELLKNYK